MAQFDPGNQYAWSDADEGMVHGPLFRWCEAVEHEQFDVFDRFLKLDALYDPLGSPSVRYTTDALQGASAESRVIDNVIASNCDSITGTLTADDVALRIETENADWSGQRRAKLEEHYVNELCRVLGVDTLNRRACHDGSRKGTGVVYPYIDAHDRIRVELVPIDEIVVDEQEANGGEPYQMARRKLIPRGRLLRMYPSKRTEILRAQKGPRDWSYWADYRPIGRDELVVVEAWYLPIGVPPNDADEDDEAELEDAEDEPTYQAGRHVICIDGCDLLDEPYNEEEFPVCTFKWTERPGGWYGIAGAERLMGHQRKLNKRAIQKDRIMDQHAWPTTYVQKADANIAVRTVSRLGAVATYSVKQPVTVFPPATSPDFQNDEAQTHDRSFEMFGQTRMAATGARPAGLYSGAAIREFRDTGTDRFATQQKGWEQLKIDVGRKLLLLCKKLAARGVEPPVLTRPAKYGARPMRWKEVETSELKAQLRVASSLADSPAALKQTATELGQAGIISKDEVRRLLDHPDIKRAMSLYTADLEFIEYTLERGLDGEPIIPIPEMNLKMAVWRGMAVYQLAEMNGAPERILEIIDQFVVLASHMVSMAQAPSQAANANAGPAGPIAPPAGPAAAPMGLPPGQEAPMLQGAGVEPLQLAG